MRWTTIPLLWQFIPPCRSQTFIFMHLFSSRHSSNKFGFALGLSKPFLFLSFGMYEHHALLAIESERQVASVVM